MKVTLTPLSQDARASVSRVGSFAILAVVALLAYLVAASFLRVKTALLFEEGVGYREKEAREKYLLDIGRALIATEEEQRQLRGYFLDEKSVADFLSNLEAIGRRLGLETDTTALGVHDGVLRVEIHVTGGYAPVVQFISLVEALPYKLSIINADLANPNGAWIARLTLDIHSFLKEK